MKKKGISLIVLIITIILILILSTTILVTILKNRPIQQANTAVLKQDIAVIQDILNLTIGDITLESLDSPVFYMDENYTQIVTDKVQINRENSTIGKLYYKTNEKKGCIVFGKEEKEKLDSENINYHYTKQELPAYQNRNLKWYVTHTNLVVVEDNDDIINGGNTTKEYQITFHPNGGNVHPTTTFIKENTPYGTLPIPTREGYQFLGWYTQPENGTFIQNTDLVTQNTILYAKWQKDPHLIAWYDGVQNTLEGHKDDTTIWVDLTGNNPKGGTINGGATWKTNGLLFDGINDWVNLNSILMPEQSDFTVSVVVSIENYPESEMYILGQATSDSSINSPRTGIKISNHLLALFHPSDTSMYTDFTPNLKEKFSLTFRRNEMFSLWVNGEKKLERDSLPILQSNTVLGKWGLAWNYYFHGIIYSVKAYDKALTDEEVKQLAAEDLKK